MRTAAIALCLTMSGCAWLGVTPRPLGTDEYQILRNRADFETAFSQKPAQEWIISALDAVNRLQGQRDAK